VRPLLLIPDAGPLFSLAAAELLHVLLHTQLVVTDIVKEETFDRGKLSGASVEAITLRAFFVKHTKDIHIQETNVGRLLKLARRVDPSTKVPNIGELSIQSLLIDLRASNPAARALVLFEDAWFIRNAVAMPRNCTLISTSAFLVNLQLAGLIPSAAEAAARIRGLRPTFSSEIATIDRAHVNKPGRK